MIDLVDGLSSRAVVLVNMTNDDFVNHDARLGGGAIERLPGHGDQAQAIPATLFVVIEMLLDNDGLGNDQTLSRRTIDEGGLQRVCSFCCSFIVSLLQRCQKSRKGFVFFFPVF